MKRTSFVIIACCLAAAILCGLTACGGWQVEVKPPQSSAEPSAAGSPAVPESSLQSGSSLIISDTSPESTPSNEETPPESLPIPEGARTELPVTPDELMPYYEKYVAGTEFAIPVGENFDEQHYFTDRNIYFLFSFACGKESFPAGSNPEVPDYPAAMVEGLIQKYFLWDVETIRANAQSDYDSVSGTYHFEGGYGGGYYPPTVTAVRQNGDLLEIDVEQWGDSYSDVSGQYLLESSYTLTVRIEPDGWKYLSNKVTYAYAAANES